MKTYLYVASGIDSHPDRTEIDFRLQIQGVPVELSIRCTQVTIWNHDKGKLILMLQVRQVISLVTSHPYLPFCRHIIPILNFISIENIFGCYFFC